MNNSAIIERIDSTFLARLDPDGKLKLTSCLQCARCSAGCTMRQETDILPHQLNRLAALGMKDQLLASKAIWACASCHTCVSRCPMGVNTPELVDRLREMAQNVPAESEVDRIRIFNNAMLGSMKRFGRVYEFAMMGEYKLRTRDFFSDLGKFPTMLLKGKMKLFPPIVSGRRSVATIFDRVRHTRRAR